jgi:hypothetical protein
MRYMAELRKASEPTVGYPNAFTAQMLNQQLFFRRFPGGMSESLAMLGQLLRQIRSEQPDRILVLSPIPSFQIVHDLPADSLLRAVSARVDLDYAEGVAQEVALLDSLRSLAAEAGWLYVDNVPELRKRKVDLRLYNRFDYHIEPPASEIIGRAQAGVILQAARSRSGRTPERKGLAGSPAVK